MSRIAVVGAGLAGLSAATLLAREGCEVVLYERSELGGRARSQVREGYTLNLGPHALYKVGAAKRVMDQLGVPVRGGQPPSRTLSLWAGRIEPLPFDPWSAVSTPLLSALERWEMARWISSLALADPATLAGRTTADWLSSMSERVAAVAGSVVRVSTYAADLDQLDAGAAASQLQRALRGVLYLDGGWQSLVDGLARAAQAAGVTVRSGQPVRSVSDLDADAVLLCVAPAVAAELSGSAALAQIASEVVPVRAACLDLGLSGLPDPARRFALGVDRPLYVSTHSDVAQLAESGTLIHAAVYGAEGDPVALEAELEVALDGLMAGWRDRVVVRRWMPRMVVAQDMPRASARGQRAPVAVADRPGVWVAGDWVGSEGMLADAAVASAAAASRAILQSVRGQEAA